MLKQSLRGGEILRALKHLLSRLSPRQRKFALGGTATLALLGLVLGVMVGGEDAKAVGNAMRNPLSIFALRSPGARLNGVLLQTKPKLASTSRRRERPIGLVPQERVLSTGRARPTPVFGAAPDLNPQVGLSAIPTGFIVGPGFDAPTPIGPGFDVPGFGFGDTPGFAGASGNPPVTGGPGPGPGPGPGSPGGAVPEISTWLMMILGLGITGLVSRRRGAGVRTTAFAA